MSMFCYQCQEAAGGKGCTKVGVCGKTADLANLQDLMIYALKGISELGLKADEAGIEMPRLDRFVIEGLFMTITNANFDKDRFFEKIKDALKLRDELKDEL
ncbi:MAG: hydroxylamine reductase, partial [Tissierellia bacterium]|nr:hydroxylamine reductase [Tissierellia bacterium]